MFMQALTTQTYALMRIVVGFLFLCHGTQKLFGFPVPSQGEAPLFIAVVAGSIEFLGGLLILVGLFTRWTAFVCSGLMAAAYWMAHGTKALLPLANRGESAVLYCFVFLVIAAQGGGVWSIDGNRGSG